MKTFVALAALLACANAGVILNALPYTQNGAVSGPVHPALGDLVATTRGLRPISLEGFSEDDDNNGFVDPIGQAVVPAPLFRAAPAPIFAAAPSPLLLNAAPYQAIAHAQPAFAQQALLSPFTYASPNFVNAPLVNAPLAGPVAAGPVIVA